MSLTLLVRVRTSLYVLGTGGALNGGLLEPRRLHAVGWEQLTVWETGMHELRVKVAGRVLMSVPE